MAPKTIYEFTFDFNVLLFSDDDLISMSSYNDDDEYTKIAVTALQIASFADVGFEIVELSSKNMSVDFIELLTQILTGSINDTVALTKEFHKCRKQVD